jgi:hypothetical protein
LQECWWKQNKNIFGIIIDPGNRFETDRNLVSQKNRRENQLKGLKKEIEKIEFSQENGKLEWERKLKEKIEFSLVNAAGNFF